MDQWLQTSAVCPLCKTAPFPGASGNSEVDAHEGGAQVARDGDEAARADTRV